MARGYQNSEQEALRAYLSDIRGTPLLSRSEEIKLARRIQQGDVRAFHQLVRANLRFVVNIVKRYKRTTVSMLDLINEGNVGLIRAAKKYNPDLGLRFISYAVWWIRNTISLFLARQGGVLAIPAKKVSLVYQIEATHQRLFNEFKRPPTAEELGAALEISANEVSELSQAISGYLSLDKYLHSAEEQSPLEVLMSNENFSLVEKHFSLLSFRETLQTLLLRLDERERQAIELYFGLDGRPTAGTFAELGRMLNVSREGARLLFHRAVKHLCELPGSGTLQDYWM